MLELAQLLRFFYRSLKISVAISRKFSLLGDFSYPSFPIKFKKKKQLSFRPAHVFKN